jgi:tRNA (guanine37-N1)-methyltransferase
MWTVNILTLFPEAYPGILGLSVLGKALANESWGMEVSNIRDFATDKHKTVDDIPFGGGGGMVLRPDVLAAAIDAKFTNNKLPLVYLSPRGERFSQRLAQQFSEQQGINILCGRFEGIDERILNEYDFRSISVGDYVLSSGDVAAMVFIDACVRLLPGVLGAKRSLEEESFSFGPEGLLLEYPHYTKPADWRGKKVPEVLRSGNHKKINAWRKQQAEEITKQVRPDLWDQYMRKKNESIT